MVEVLVVDDSMTVRAIVGKALRAAGYGVAEAADGLDALAKIRAEPPALVVCDINMPRMSGLEMLAELRAKGGAQVPVLMLTTEAQPELLLKAKALGAKGWMIKPLKLDLLLATVRKLALQ